MRVQSYRPTKNGGWLHRLGEKPKFIPKPEPEVPEIDAEGLMQEWSHLTRWSWVCSFADQLSVTGNSLMDIGIAWAEPHHAWAFPMFNGNGHCVGIRLRLQDGRKLSVRGGKEGLFLPHGGNHTAYLVEGPTDLAAARTLGLWGIGRPSCRGAVAHTQVTINRLGIRRVIIIGDNDAPGIDGAKALAAELQVPVACMLLPCKDLRAYVQMGGTIGLIRSLEEQLVWRQPK